MQQCKLCLCFVCHIISLKFECCGHLANFCLPQLCGWYITGVQCTLTWPAEIVTHFGPSRKEPVLIKKNKKSIINRSGCLKRNPVIDQALTTATWSNVLTVVLTQKYMVGELQAYHTEEERRESRSQGPELLHEPRCYNCSRQQRGQQSQEPIQSYSTPWINYYIYHLIFWQVIALLMC